MTRDRAIETETTLVIPAPSARETADAVAAARAVAGHRLVLEPDRRIRDVYVDDAGRTLSGVGLALRWRRETREGRLTDRITLKGALEPLPPGPSRSGQVASPSARTAVRRLEVERPFSPEGWVEIDSALGASGVQLSAPHWPADMPEDALSASGLERVQARETWRRPRAVVSPDGHACAELVVDAVTYELEEGTLVHHEIEVEAVSADAALDRIVDELMARHRSLLGPWRHSKLEVGEALVRLAVAGELDALTTGELGAADYARIEALCERAARAGATR